MGKTRSPNRDEAFKIYKEHDGKIAPKEIAEMLGEKTVNIYSWKKNDEWDIQLNGKVGAPFGNKNAVGNKGGAPKGNLNNLQHGDYYDPTKHLEKSFLRKYLPAATKKIIKETVEAGLNSLDILWTNIQLQFAQIIRSQKIMHVTNKNEMIKELKKSKVKNKDRKTDKTSTNESEEEIEYEFQFAWDRQATLLNSQSKAMSTLQNMISKYEELLHKNWDLASEEQKLRIEKLKAGLSKGTKKDEPIQIVIKRKSKE
ncbi:phage terminase small subunit [Clostridium sp. YIM B02555]|uniref:phage terminase small subunit n=1 Tax=Clostridium sp. YIM B02555 TaxID=2911968 RepID=UPI001EED7DDD|nr:phage terminase small subunit [Clostridium sp. YIM B02555]